MAKKWSKAPLLAKWAGEGEGDGRAYTDPTTKKDYPSVTTILKNTPKADMMGWAAMKVAETIIDEYDRIGGDPDEVMKWLPYAHNRYRDERGWVGSGVHATIQADFEESWDYHELDAEQERILGRWEQFKRVYKVTILMSEVTVVGDGYMGTFDAIIEYTDPLTGETHIALVDFKTSKSIWSENRMQLAALAAAPHVMRQVEKDAEGAVEHKKTIDGRVSRTYWVKEDMPSFDTVAIVHLREDLWGWHEVENLDLHYAKFMHYVGIWELDKKLKEVGDE